MKKYLFSILITFISIILTLLFTTTLYYFNLINHTTYNILKIILLILSLFINSFILGKKSTKKGYLEGIKLSLPIIIFSLICQILVKKHGLFSILRYNRFTMNGGVLYGVHYK